MTGPWHPWVDAVDPIIEELAPVHQVTGLQYADIFRDWLALLLAMYSGDDDRHAEVLARYDDLADPQTVAARYSVATARFWEVMVEVQYDVLGAVYAALESGTSAPDCSGHSEACKRK